jgi:hypothetical protein
MLHLPYLFSLHVHSNIVKTGLSESLRTNIFRQNLRIFNEEVLAGLKIHLLQRSIDNSTKHFCKFIWLNVTNYDLYCRETILLMKSTPSFSNLFKNCSQDSILVRF